MENKTYYFNMIISEEIIEKKYLLSKKWNKCNMILNNNHYIVDYLLYENEHYFKTIKDYNTKKYNELFNINKTFSKDKIIKLINYN